MAEIAHYRAENLKWDSTSEINVVVNISLIKIIWWYVPQ